MDLRTITFEMISRSFFVSAFPNFRAKKFLELKERRTLRFFPFLEEGDQFKQNNSKTSVPSAILWYIVHSAALWRVRINYLITRLINPFQAPLFSHRVRWFCVGPAWLSVPGRFLLHLLRCLPLFNEQTSSNRWKIFMPIKRQIRRVPFLETDVFLPAELQFFNKPFGRISQFRSEVRENGIL